MNTTTMLTKIDRTSRLPWFENPVEDLSQVRYDGMVENIQQEVGRFAYGVSSDKISSRYNFISADDARNFFRSMEANNPGLLNGVSDAQPLETLVLNLQDGGSTASQLQASEVFKSKASEIADLVATQKRETVRIVVGPTGAGKTAFSKGLFTCGLQRFWGRKVIPSRIEYRWSAEYELDEYIFVAATRDFLAYLCIAASETDFDIFINHFAGLRFAEEIIEFRRLGLELDLNDGDDWVAEFSSQIKNWMFSEENVELWEQIAQKSISVLGVRYLFSFDGFDAVSPLEVFSSNEISEPVATLCKFLDRSLISRKPKRVFLTNANAHFLIYVRDTTLSIIQRKLTKNPVGRTASDFDWICPPSYRSVAAILTRRLCNDRVPATKRTEFVTSVVDSVKRNVELHLGSTEPRLISNVFGWNVRNMKAHYGRLVLILFNRLSHDDAIFRQKIVEAGVTQYIFDDFVVIQSDREIRDYEVGRSLVFQTMTKEVGCRLTVERNRLLEMMKVDSVPEKFVESLDVQWDDGSIGDLLFNGFFDESFPVNADRACFIPIYILKRLSLSKRGTTTPTIIYRFLIRAGLVEEGAAGLKLVEFCVGWMTATGLVIAQKTTTNPAPKDRSYKISMAGRYLLGGGAFKVSYLDSAFFASYWPDNLLTGTGPKSANSSFGQSVLYGVENSCSLAEHLLIVEDTIRTQVRSNSPHLMRDYKETFTWVKNNLSSLLDECGHILRQDMRRIYPSEYDAAYQAAQRLKGLMDA